MKRIRKMTWALIGWSAFFVSWIIGALMTQPALDADCVALLGRQACQDAADAGTGIGIGIIIVLWFIGFIVLSLVWFMTRPKDIVR